MMESMSSIHSGGLLLVLLKFLTPRDRWRFKDVSTEFRRAVLSPEHERVCMLECLKITHGYWNEQAALLRLSVSGAPAGAIGEIESWLKLQLLLEHEMCHHFYRAPDKFEIGSFEWVRIPDPHLDKLNHSLKYLCPAWNSGCQDDQSDEFHQDLAVYTLDNPSDKEAATRLFQTLDLPSLTKAATRLNFGWDMYSWDQQWFGRGSQPGDAMRLLYAPPKEAYDYIKQWVCTEAHTERVADAWEDFADDPSTMPGSLLAPFIIRVLLQYPDLVARLTDINDPLTPPLFLNAVCDTKIYSAEKVILWDIDIREALNKHNAVFTMDLSSFWDNVAIEVGPRPTAEFSAPKKRKSEEPPLQLPTNKAFELDTWVDVARCITRHEKAKLEEVHRYILSRYAEELVPFDMRRLSKSDLVPDCSEVIGDTENCQTAVVELVISDADNGPNPKMALNDHMGDLTVMFVSGSNAALLFKRTGNRC